MDNIYDPTYVKKLFNQMSSSYERMNYITSFGFSIRWRKQFLKKLGQSMEKLQVIDLLSGRGENWSYLKRNFPNSTIYGLDFSENMINYSMRRASKLFNNECHIICTDMLDNNLASNKFDIVSCAYGLKTFNEEQLNIIAKEVHRILKPQGKFSFVEVSKPKDKLLQYVYRIYLGIIIPVLGKIFFGNPEDYKMLWVYIQEFGTAEKVQQIFQKHNLNVQLDRYFGGCAKGISGTKKDSTEP